MNHDLLHVFLVTAECGSFSSAARQLYITPAAVMKKINLLEKETGMNLFVRSHRGLELTPAGQSFRRDVRHLLSSYDAAVARARQLSVPHPDIIRVGNSQMRNAQPLLDLWQQLAGSHPEYKVTIIPFLDTVDELDQIFHHLGSRIDLLVAPFDLEVWHDYFQALPLQKLTYEIALPPGHRLTHKKCLRSEDLIGETLMINDFGSSKKFDALRERLSTEYPGIHLVTGSPYRNIDYINALMKNNVLFLTNNVQSAAYPYIRTVPVEWSLTMDYGILYPLHPSPAVAGFVSLLQKQLKKKDQES